MKQASSPEGLQPHVARAGPGGVRTTNPSRTAWRAVVSMCREKELACERHPARRERHRRKQASGARLLHHCSKMSTLASPYADEV